MSISWQSLTRLMNAPFTLWLLSAIALTIGGSYFTGHQKCEGDADAAITNYYKLQNEMIRRLEYLGSKIAHANTIEDIRIALQNHPSVYADLKERTTRDIDYELTRTERLIDFSRVAQLVNNQTKEFLAGAPALELTPQNIAHYGAVVEGEEPLDLTDDDLVPLKNFAEALISHHLARLYALNRLPLGPRCDFVNSLKGVPTRGHRKVIEPDFTD